MKIKKILALAVALTSVFAVAGCGSTGDSSSKVSTVKKVKVEDTQEIETIPDDAQKTIRWMGTYDLNPDEKKGEDKSVEMTLFNNKGGKVEYTRVTVAKNLTSSLVLSWLSRMCLISSSMSGWHSLHRCLRICISRLTIL